MKGALLAAALLGSAQAGGVHKMKLKKVPLSEQLETVPLNTQMQRIGQKYMGAGANRGAHAEAMFRNQGFRVEGNHPVPVSNFMNAQCKFIAFPSHTEARTDRYKTSPRSPSELPVRPSRSSWIRAAPTSGFRRRTATRSLATSTPSTTRRLRPPSRRTVRRSISDTDPAVSADISRRTP